MRPIIYTFRATSKSARAIATMLLLGESLLAPCAIGSTRPRYGGVLRLQMSQRVNTLDPRSWPADSVQGAASEKLASLVFDRLVRYDDQGEIQPELAISWEHDALSKRWQFRLRTGVKFTDGTPLSPETVALALQQLLGNSFDVSATGDSVVIQADHSMLDLPSRLAMGRYFIFHATSNGMLSGTGPFRVTEWPSASPGAKVRAARSVFEANESCWAGRPFMDQLEITMGVAAPTQANAVAFGQTDVAALDANEVRAATQRGVRLRSSEPIDLLALQFDATRPLVQEPSVRRAMSLAIDRSSIADVILQKEAVPAGGLLPNWISGYAHLFSVAPDVETARQLLISAQRKFSRTTTLTLVYDSEDTDERAVAERVSVNLRELGILVQTKGFVGGSAGGSPPAEMHLVRVHIGTPEPAIALEEVLAAIGEPLIGMEKLEECYAVERAPIDAFRVIPLVHVPETYGLSPQVRDWMPPRWGGWRLEEVWIAPAAGGTAP